MISKILKILGALCLIYSALIVMMYTSQRSMMYLPPNIPAEDFKKLEGFEKISVTTRDGFKIHGYLERPKAGQPLVIVFHGNAGHAAWQVYKFPELRACGVGLLLAEYRGYDGNPGIPHEAGLYKDAEAFVEFAERDIKAPIILYGESLGTGVAVEMAKRHDVAGVILEVPFDSTLAVARHHYPFVPFMNLIMKDQYRSDLKIKQVQEPVLILLAGRDLVVPVELGQNLYHLANEPKEKILFEKAGHLDVYEFGAGSYVLDFVAEYSK